MNVSNFGQSGRQPTPLSTTVSNGTRLREEAATEGGVGGVDVTEDEKKEEPVTWRSLPHRRQLIILTLARLSEPLVQTSLQVFQSLSEFSAYKSADIVLVPVIYVLPT
jgi:hypothetical protein